MDNGGAVWYDPATSAPQKTGAVLTLPDGTVSYRLNIVPVGATDYAARRTER